VFQRMVTNVAVGIVLLVFAVVAGVVGWQMGRPAHHSGPSATTTLLQAVRTMESASSYQFAGQVTIGVEVLKLGGQFSSPDRLHETLTLVGGPPVERVVIGPTTYQKGLAAWTKVSSSASAADPRATFNALAGVSHVHLSGSTYSFELTGTSASALVAGSDPSTTINGTATVVSGFIYTLSYQSPAGAGTTVSFTYGGVNSTPPVTAPPGVA